MSGHDEAERWRELATGLRRLRPEPPPTLRPAVLERVGLADAFITVEGPAGPLLVAYNGRGISAVLRSTSRSKSDTPRRSNRGGAPRAAGPRAPPGE